MMLQALAGSAPPARRDAIALPDGRALAWCEWGPADGLPVLFCTGAATSGRLGFGAAALPGMGLRLLAVDRPGLGRSDPDPAKSFASWTADVGALVDARGLGTPLAVGFSQGAPFALALAAAGRARAVALVSPQDELAHPRIRPLLHPDVAALVAAAEADGFEAAFARVATADGFLGMVAAMSGPRDRELYAAEPFRGAFEAAVRDTFARGAAGYARDLALSLRRWPFAVEEVAAPVDLWLGAQDTSPVHSPDSGAALAERLPRATRTVDPDEGGSILWTRAADILARLRAHALRPEAPR